jgi:hypothetical protein
MMFLCALARPRYNNTTTRQWFDGLIGIYPVGEFNMLYKHASRNHARGEIKWTNFALDREEYQRMMVNLVLPDNNNIIVQQDGAKAQDSTSG